MKFMVLFTVVFSGCYIVSCASSNHVKKESETFNNISSNMGSIYDIHILNLNGDSLNFSDFKGKKILVVNVASECGFTPQYEGLQELYSTYGDKLVIIGVPCNQFGGQEPGTHEEIASFCQKNYGVTFPITEKIDVKGENQHPLYQWLTSKALNGKEDSEVKWNFHKYLIDENGSYVAQFSTRTEPMSEDIISKL